MHIFASSFEFDSIGCENVNIRKKYRLFLLGVLALCLAGAGGLNYVQLLEQIPDSYIQTEGEPMPDGISPLITEEVRADGDLLSVEKEHGSRWNACYKCYPTRRNY